MFLFFKMNCSYYGETLPHFPLLIQCCKEHICNIYYVDLPRFTGFQINLSFNCLKQVHSLWLLTCLLYLLLYHFVFLFLLCFLVFVFSSFALFFSLCLFVLFSSIAFTHALYFLLVIRKLLSLALFVYSIQRSSIWSPLQQNSNMLYLFYSFSLLAFVLLFPILTQFGIFTSNCFQAF